MTANASLDEKIKSATEIFNKYEGLIRSAIYVNLSDYSRADDIYQSLFLSLVHKPIPTYVRNTKAYLYKIIQRNIYDTIQSTDKNQKRLYEYGKCQRRGSEIRKPQDVLIQ
ncbi:RNA polymerase sigma factor [Planctomycetota bacterium]